MATGMFHTHMLFVVLFTFIYLLKTILLLSDKKEILNNFKKKTKVFEMVVSFGFLATGVYLLVKLPEINQFMILKIVLVLASIPVAIIGYKKENKIMATLSFLLIIVSFSLAYKANDAKAGEQIASTDGKEIFETKCASCHGADGKLGLGGAKDLSATTLAQPEIVKIITNGKNTMASYRGVLTDEQITAVTAYIENDLKGK